MLCYHRASFHEDLMSKDMPYDTGVTLEPTLWSGRTYNSYLDSWHIVSWANHMFLFHYFSPVVLGAKHVRAVVPIMNNTGVFSPKWEGRAIVTPTSNDPLCRKGHTPLSYPAEPIVGQLEGGFALCRWSSLSFLLSWLLIVLLPFDYHN